MWHLICIEGYAGMQEAFEMGKGIVNYGTQPFSHESICFATPILQFPYYHVINC